MEQKTKINPVIATVVVIAIVGLMTGAVIFLGNNEEANESGATTQTTETSQSSNSSDATSAMLNFKDGTYEATGTYSTPGGRESIGLKVTIVNNIISEITLDQHATGGESAQYQGQFASDYKSLVVGKKVSDVSLSRVAGSSLTSSGFNNALDQIKTDASQG